MRNATDATASSMASIANNSTYVAKNVNHINELIAIQASVWGQAVAIGENVDRAIVTHSGSRCQTIKGDTFWIHNK